MRVFAKIQEEDAERANKDGFTKHKPHIGNIFSQIPAEYQRPPTATVEIFTVSAAIPSKPILSNLNNVFWI